jgi:outer membrane protein OmpA-like peptidoglycan-associated protein
MKVLRNNMQSLKGDMIDKGFKNRLAAKRHQTLKPTIVIIFFCFFTIIGCAVIQGTSIKTYESEYHDTVQASSDTLKRLRIPETESKSDELKTVINAERFDGSPVTIEVKRIDRNFTEVSVRTGKGLGGDKKVSTQIHEFINENIEKMAKDDTKHIGNSDSTQEIINTNIDDKIQSMSHLKLAETYSDSIYLIFFNNNSNELSEKAVKKVNRVAEVILKNPKAEVILKGYTDSIGEPSYNKMVSESRANVVKAYLIGNGVEPSKIMTIGYGAQNFLASNKTKEGRQFNRRVAIELNNLE